MDGRWAREECAGFLIDGLWYFPLAILQTYSLPLENAHSGYAVVPTQVSFFWKMVTFVNMPEMGSSGLLLMGA